MGGCATKPKVSKGEGDNVPQPGPEDPGKGETVAAVAKDVAVVDHDEKEVEEDVGGDHDVAKVKEIVEDDKADDQESKPRSLSNLFKTEGGEDPTKADNSPSEPLKEESEEPGEPKEEPETKEPEAEKTVIPVEQIAAQEFVDAPEKPLAETATDATLAEETITEDAKSSEIKTEGSKSPVKETKEVETENNVKDSEPADEKITEKSSEVPT